MKLYRQALYILLTILLSLSTAHAVSEEKMEERRKTTWGMELQLNVPRLKPEVVQWALFKEDPVPGYRQRLERGKVIYTKILAETAEEDKQLAIACQMLACWNFGFSQIPGDLVYLLTRELNHSFSSDSYAGKKWMVTKARFMDNKPVCWVIPIEAEIGERVDIKLSEENVFDLSEIYNEIMNK